MFETKLLAKAKTLRSSGKASERRTALKQREYSHEYLLRSSRERRTLRSFGLSISCAPRICTWRSATTTRRRRQRQRVRAILYSVASAFREKIGGTGYTRSPHALAHTRTQPTLLFTREQAQVRTYARIFRCSTR